MNGSLQSNFSIILTNLGRMVLAKVVQNDWFRRLYQQCQLFATSASEETEHTTTDECQTEQLTRNIPTEIVAI